MKHRSLAAITLTFGLLSSVTLASAQSGPFAGLAGSWSGAGFISLSDGSRERLRCRATYRVAGGDRQLQQSLRCASDSYRFDLNSDIANDRGTISGNFTETSRNIGGSIAGRASGGSISAVVQAAGFTANINVTTRGNSQSVSISSQGEIRNIAITMARS